MSALEPMQQWIADHHGPDWAILLIGPGLDITLISEGAVMRGRLHQPSGLSGIHFRDLLVIADLDQEDWMPDLVAALTSGAGARHVPYTRDGR